MTKTLFIIMFFFANGQMEFSSRHGHVAASVSQRLWLRLNAKRCETEESK